MNQLPTAKKIFDPYLFSSTARWIRRSGAERHSHNIFRGSFSLESLPASASMLVMSAGYAEIYVNGSFAATVAERSYIFDKSYEVFDISLKEVDGEPGMFFNNKSLIQFLKDWQAMKELLASGSQTADNYEIWKTIRPSVTKVVHED